MRCLLAIVVAAHVLSCTSEPSDETQASLWFDPDTKVRAQDDVFLYANASWLGRTRVPEQRAATDLTAELKERNALARVKALEASVVGVDESETSPLEILLPATLLKTFLDTKRLEELGTSPIKDLLDEIDALTNQQQLLALWGRLRIIGVEAPLAVRLSQDAADQTLRPMLLISPSIVAYSDALSRLHPAQKPEIAHARMSSALLTAIGATIELSHVDKVFAIDRTLISAVRAEDGKPLALAPSRMDLKALTSSMPGLRVSDYLAGAELGLSEVVLVSDIKQLAKLSSLLAQEPMHVWRTYTKIRLLTSYGYLLMSKVAKPVAELRWGDYVLDGKGGLVRTRIAAEFVDSRLPELTSELFALRSLSSHDVEAARNIVAAVVGEYQDRLRQASWLSSSTRQRLVDQLRKTTILVGSPGVPATLGQIDLKNAELVALTRQLERASYLREIARCGTSANSNAAWPARAHDPYVGYDLVSNRLTVTAGLLQMPVFSPTAPAAFNYGGLGYLVARAISQALLSSEAGLTSDELALMRERLKPLTVDYASGAFGMERIIDSEAVAAQVAPEIAAISVAKAALARLGEGQRTNIEGHSEAQSFFLAVAQVNRQKLASTTETLLKKSSRIPMTNKEKTLGAFANSEDFRKAFAVKANDRLYRSKPEVSLW